MLAAWAACCMVFGVTVSLFGVDQGWINFVGVSKPSEDKQLVLEAGEATEKDAARAKEEYDAMTSRLLGTSVAKECLENADEWKRVPYFWVTNEESFKAAFVPGTLHGPDRLSVEPVVFLHRDRQKFIVVLHIGKLLCGHDGIVHGGAQAVLFDEITARPAFWNLPRNVALTASLKINYRRPVVADQILVFRTQVATMEGRKATVTAQLEDVKGNLLSDAEALYVSPSNEKLVPGRSSEIQAIESAYPGRF
ncbi:hypothetical protein GGI02_004261 [Coemansia sp. RSA 2322]|uniref:Thioesterase domain-containing protein n=1 Tax=Coemansia thaxteri TaxID=2663907 RepID=A0A9W8BH56_9FUNG|nr:hypothetical protein H4R26_001253 [Coemansia thaxteri]KAJ2466775.1 hypothetical protein GGI02_004261 [Coemansia sp. RSA 2322]KAJ2484931.1 hypothetical protein EV174_002069 [Coemansia sp. RSA 2320]